VEQEAVQNVFNDSPEENTKQPVAKSEELVVEALRSDVGAICDAWQPNKRDHIPSGLGERFKKVSKQRRRLAALVMARTMDLVQIEFLGESTEPELREKRPVQIEKLVLLVVHVVVCFPTQILLAGHSGSRMDCDIGVPVGQLPIAIAVGSSIGMSVDGLFGNEKSDKALIEDLISRVRMSVRIRIFQDLFDIAAGIFENVFGTARMILNKVGNVVDLIADSDIARVPRVVLFDLGTGEGWKCTSRHLVEAAVGGLGSRRWLEDER
jgi:hypothetical protein